MNRWILFVLLCAGRLCAQSQPYVSTIVPWSETALESQTVQVHDGDWVEVHLICKPVFPWRCGGMAAYFPPGSDESQRFDGLYSYEDLQGFTHEGFGTYVTFAGEMQVFVPVIYEGAQYNLMLEVVSAQ